MFSKTAKLPKGQAYLLRPSVLEAALAAAGIVIGTELIRSPGGLFDADFSPAKYRMGPEMLFIRCGSVPSKDVTVLRNRMETEALPRLVGWIGGILAQDRNAPMRRETQSIDFSRYCRPFVTTDETPGIS